MGNVASPDFRLLQAEMQSALPDYRFVTKCQRVSGTFESLVRYAPMVFSQMLHIATSKLVILDSYCIPVSVLKHKRSLKVVQIWHAIGLMKKAGYAALGAEEGRSEELAMLLSMHRGYTHILVNSPACETAILQVFGYVEDSPSRHGHAHKEVLVGALPRVDRVQDGAAKAKMRARIYKTHPSLKGKKVILYAPTSRKNMAPLFEKVEQLVEAVRQANRRGANFALVVRLHPGNRKYWEGPFEGLDEEEAENIDVQDDDVLFNAKFSTAEMGMVADACISDYSSLIYEFMIMRKPVYFFAFDLEEYEKARGIFIDYRKEVPGTVHDDAEDLVQAIVNSECALKKQQAFLKKYVSYSAGRNSQTLAEGIVRIVADG
ncbi:MAG: CDP-glycerol glycerophosphotransferase family protein [Eggerthellaceae bacterium]|nr:CDP-glycerol glycerophosphotransferase family protein [Eggerthellaceae bacterium]